MLAVSCTIRHLLTFAVLQIKRRTEMGGALSLASLLFFSGTIIG